MLLETRRVVGSLSLAGVEMHEEGSPLVLLHGLAQRWQNWLPIMPALGVRWQVMAFDHRGHGLSDRASSYRLIDYAEDYAALLRELPEPAVLVGHSLGGGIAWEVARLIPDRVRALCVLDMNLWPDTLDPDLMPWVEGVVRVIAAAKETGSVEAAVAYFQEQISNRGAAGAAREFAPPNMFPGDETEATLRNISTALLQADAGVLRAFADGSYADGADADATVARISCPVLLLQGQVARHGLMSDSDVQRARAALGHRLTHVSLEGVGHWAHMDDPVRTARVLHNFLESVER